MLLLGSLSLPSLAATGVNLKCDDALPQPADLTATSAVPAEAAGDHEALKVLKAEGDVKSLSPASELGRILDSEFDEDSPSAIRRQQALRSSALADALEKRRQGRMSSPADDIAPMDSVPPPVDTALPGVGDAESLLFRRQMYRTDI